MIFGQCKFRVFVCELGTKIWIDKGPEAKGVVEEPVHLSLKSTQAHLTLPFTSSELLDRIMKEAPDPSLPLPLTCQTNPLPSIRTSSWPWRSCYSFHFPIGHSGSRHDTSCSLHQWRTQGVGLPTDARSLTAKLSSKLCIWQQKYLQLVQKGESERWGPRD